MTVDQVKTLLKTCAVNTFEARRDAAIIRTLVDTGMRVSGLISMRAEPRWLNLDSYTVRIVLKGGDEHNVPIGNNTTLASNRYLLLRARTIVGHATLAEIERIYAWVMKKYRAREAQVMGRMLPLASRATPLPRRRGSRRRR